MQLPFRHFGLKQIVRACIVMPALSLAFMVASPAMAAGVGAAVEHATAARLESVLGRRMLRGTAERRPPLAATPKAKNAGCGAIANKCAGIGREQAAARILRERYPHKRIQAETYLLTRSGRKAIDPGTRTARRIDYVMFSKGKVSRRFEITSQHASKALQLAKERRILALRANGAPRLGGIYVRDRATGGLVKTAPKISEVMRLH